MFDRRPPLRRAGGQHSALPTLGADLILDPHDINRDAKWRRLVMKEGSGGDIGASPAAWRC